MVSNTYDYKPVTAMRLWLEIPRLRLDLPHPLHKRGERTTLGMAVRQRKL